MYRLEMKIVKADMLLVSTKNINEAHSHDVKFLWLFNVWEGELARNGEEALKAK